MTITIHNEPPQALSAQLKDALFDLGVTREQLSRAHERIGALERDKEALAAKVARLERDNADLRRQCYAPSSERRPLPANDSEDSARSPPTSSAPPTEAPKPEPPRRAAPHGRAPLAPGLPRRDVPLELEESKRRCPDCGQDCRPFDTETTEVLDLAPSAFEVIRYRRQRWSCPTCQNQVFRPDLPVPIPRARASARVLAYVATAKFADHLPHYRIAGILARQGLDVSRSTLGDWNRGTVKLLKHVVAAIEQDVMASPIVGTDETIIAVRDKTAPNKKNMRTGRIWLYRGAPGDCLMKYTPDKGGEWPAQVLKDYSGIVQVDAANTFDRLFKDGTRTKAGCNAHARRKVVKVEDLTEAGPLLEKYRALYEVEAEAKKRRLSPEERLQLRRERSCPIMDELYAIFRALPTQAGTPLAAAVGYALNHEIALRRFLEDGRIEIDNNNVERFFSTTAMKTGTG